MKETDFIQQNKKKWARFEKLSANKNNDPDEVSELFTEITEDLSYARTFYPRRTVRVYLNQLSQRVFTSLYRQRKQPIGSFLKFWTEVAPLEIYRARRNILVAFIFFSLAMLVGALSQHYDTDFVRVILGDYYVSSTESRIEAGNPMGVYGEQGSSSMFFEITVNNIRVAFMAFVSGILLTLGSYWIMLQNGIMLGAFQWWFKAKGLLFVSFLAIWIHGAFEISAIIISGGAGITLGNGIIFPRSYSRIQSLIFSAKRGMIIMLSLIPFFILAGALESYITRHYLTMPTALKLGIILCSFGLILFFYVFYPIMVARKFPEKIIPEEIPRYIPKREITWYKIRKPGEIFTDTFNLFVAKFSKFSQIFFRIIFPMCLVLMVVIFLVEYARFDYILYWYDTMGTLFGTHDDFTFYKFFGWSVPLTFMITSCGYVMHDESTEISMRLYLKYTLRHFLSIYLFSLVIYSIFLFSPGWVLFFAIFIAPFLVVIGSIITLEKVNFFKAVARSFEINNNGYGNALGAMIALICISMIFFFMLHNPFEMGIIMLIDEILKEALITTTDYYMVIIAAVNSVIYLLYFFVVLTICFVAFNLMNYSALESKTARGLYERLEKFGRRNKNFETEIDFE